MDDEWVKAVEGAADVPPLRLRISVTKHHIQKGSRQSCQYCPLSMAVADAINKVDDGLSSWLVRSGGGGVSFLVKDGMTDCAYRFAANFSEGHILQQFVRNFDLRKEVKPFKTDLEFRWEPEWGIKNGHKPPHAKRIVSTFNTHFDKSKKR